MKKILLLPIALLLINCSDMKNDHTTARSNLLAHEVDYKDKVNSRIYYESEAYKMILFAMKKEHQLKPHSAPMDTPLLMLEGEVKITIDEKVHILKAGESIILPKNIDHGVYPISAIKFVLIK